MADLPRAQYVARLRARLDAIPRAVTAAVEAQLRTEAAALAATMRRFVPIDSGALRASIRVEENDKPLSLNVIAGGVEGTRRKPRPHKRRFRIARPAKVRHQDSARLVEFGHIAADGSKVAAKPFFYPAYRSRKKGIQRRLRAAARKAFKVSVT